MNGNSYHDEAGHMPRVIHGTPITPRHLLDQLVGQSFCVSFADPRDIERCVELVADDGIVILDNGAFTIWQAEEEAKRTGKPVKLPKRLQFRDRDEYRRTFWAWANEWMAICDRCVAVIPDVIMGCPRENLEELTWAIGGSEPFSGRDDESLCWYPERAMAIWHLDDSFEQLQTMTRVCNFIGLGSCAEYDVQKNRSGYLERIAEAKANIEYIDKFENKRTWTHLMRGLAVLPQAVWFDSADSSNVARNHCRTKGQPMHVAAMSNRIRQSVFEACA